MLPDTTAMLSAFKASSSRALAGEGEVMVEGRRRTESLVLGGEMWARDVRTAIPSSPAPRTRMLVVILIQFEIGVNRMKII